jgi:hypothetical protein
MSLSAQIKALTNSFVDSPSVRYAAYPVGAGIAAVSDSAAGAWAWSAYVQVVAAATLPDPCWLVGFTYANGAVEDIDADIAIATGDAAAEADIAIIPIRSLLETSVGAGVVTPIILPYPVKIAGSPRVAVRIRKDTAASAAGGTLKILVATAVGS